jgi:YesN/AraC family two-component response regulator
MLKAQNRAQHILIVDDEPTLVFFLKQDLSQLQLACQVDNAAGGEEALSKLTLNKYDLLITDLKMTGINGLTLIEVARSLQPDIRVILMTAFGSREVEDKANQLQVDGYLTKPFPTAKLRDLATKLLREKKLMAKL